MKGKIVFLAGIATGFVLGSKAGRQAYERLSAKAQQLWGDPNLQKVVTHAEQLAKDAASVAQAKVSDLLDQATTAVGHEHEHRHGHAAGDAAWPGGTAGPNGFAEPHDAAEPHDTAEPRGESR